MNELYHDWRTLPELTKMRIEMLAKEFRFALDHAPTVDAVPVVHGRWVFDRPNHYKCSVCDAMWSGVVRFMKFCPNCGAKMDDYVMNTLSKEEIVDKALQKAGVYIDFKEPFERVVDA